MTAAQKLSIFWGITTIIYILVSSFTKGWGWTWIIFIVAGIAATFLLPEKGGR